MIAGIGNDIVRIVRIEQALQRHGDAFARKVLGDLEWPVFEARRAQSAARAIRFLATRFAVKEAFGKAFGTGVSDPVTLRNVQTVSGASGKPELHYGEPLKSAMAERGWRAHVSLSDEREYAVAFVIIETDSHGYD